MNDRRRRWRWPLAVGLVVVASALSIALTTPTTTMTDLDPESAAPEGSRALAEVLRQHGVSVERVQHTADAANAAITGTTLVVVHPDLLGPEQLGELTGGGADVVLVEPDDVALSGLAPPVSTAGTAPAAMLAPACGDADALTAGRARAGGQLYQFSPEAKGQLCYRDAADASRGMLALIDAGDHQVAVVGQGDVLRNGHLLDGGDAALAIRLLGANAHLVWYLPDPAELTDFASQPTLSSLVPQWIWWVIGQLAVTSVLALAWRGRRLGALVVEPLPVVVRAAETQEGRARLYRRSGARGHAAATLRTATLRRLAARLRLGPQASPDVLVDLVAQASGAEPAHTREVLLGGSPRDDAALVRLADDLAALEAQATATMTENHSSQHPVQPAPDQSREADRT